MTVSETVDRSVLTFNQPSVFIKYVELYCRKSVVWFLVPLAYNLTLMIGCAVFGFLVRHLPDNFNDSLFIFKSVSTTLFFWILFFPAYFTAYHAYIRSVMIGFCMVSNIGVILGCQFLRIAYAVLFLQTDKIKFNSTGDSHASSSSDMAVMSRPEGTRNNVKTPASSCGPQNYAGICTTDCDI